MRNRNVGCLVIGIGVVMAIVILLFNRLVKQNLSLTCSHGSSCQMYSGLNLQTWISLAVVGVIFIIGLFLIFARESTIIKTKKIKDKQKEIDMSKLDKSEKEIVNLLKNENGGIFQASLMEKLDMGKVGMTRMLDKLEAKQIIERKRRGMNNFIVLSR